MELIDTHAHLDEEAFGADIDEVVQRALEAGVVRVITIGTTAASSRAAVELAKRFDPVCAAVGIQPNYVAGAQPDDWNLIEQLANEAGVVAIGETGLDRYWDYAPLDQQIDSFERHLDLSRRTGKPFVVHCREAEADVVQHLTRASEGGVLRGVMHSFSGDQNTARRCLDLGLFISFAGMLTYRKSEALRSVARIIPRDRLLIETDAPYLVPHPARRKRKRNEPALVVQTAECLANVLDMTVSEIAEVTTRNARELFSL